MPILRKTEGRLCVPRSAFQLYIYKHTYIFPGSLLTPNPPLQSQYADDVTAFLPEEDSLPAFLVAMDLFGAATGQRLNPAKSKAMMMGARTLPDVCPHAMLPWVRSAKALGVTFHEGVGQPTIDWPAKVAAVEHRLRSLATLPVSAMGRGLACAAYGVSQLLFHAEFGGMPPHQLLRGLTSTIAALIDSGVAPGQQVGPRFAGVAADLLIGSPKEGGFGVLPLAQHIRARHAVSHARWHSLARRLGQQLLAARWHLSRRRATPLLSLPGNRHCLSGQHCRRP